MRQGFAYVLRVSRMLLALCATGLFVSVHGAGFVDGFDTWFRANSVRGLGTSCSARLAWHEAHLLNSCLDVFDATGEAIWLDQFAAHADTMLSVRADVPCAESVWAGYADGFWGWGTTRYDSQGRYQEYFIHDACIGLPLLRFAGRVFSEPERFGRFVPAARGYVGVVESDIIAKWHANWAACRGTGEELEHFGGWRNVPCNQFLAFGELLLLAAGLRESPLHPGPDARVPDDFLKAVPDSMARLVKSGLRYDPEHDAYTWGHWPATRPNSRPEDLAHANAVISFVIAAERQGIAFVPADLARFRRALTEVAWNGSLDAPRFSRLVDGTGPNDTVLALFDWTRLDSTAALIAAALRPQVEFRGAAAMNAGMARTVAALGRSQSLFSHESDVPENGPVPDTAGVLAAAPGVFRRETVVHYRVVRPGSVTLTVHDLSGRLVRYLSRGWRESGMYAVNWRGHDEKNRPVPAGAYFCRLTTPDGGFACRLVLVR
ncbi:MAG: FlgD immunoglobulin-like domain containing protein [candidate division WOR-3 bacterium]